MISCSISPEYALGIIPLLTGLENSQSSPIKVDMYSIDIFPYIWVVWHKMNDFATHLGKMWLALLSASRSHRYALKCLSYAIQTLFWELLFFFVILLFCMVAL